MEVKVSRRVLVAGCAVLVASGAGAQVTTSRQAESAYRREFLGSVYRPDVRSPRNYEGRDPYGTEECLRERATGKIVCHTRGQWKEIAARIAAGRAWND